MANNGPNWFTGASCSTCRQAKVRFLCPCLQPSHLGLVYIPYAEMVYLNRLNIRPALFCLAAAGVVLRSAVLRPDSFAAAGSGLTPSNHPDLFRLVESVKTDTRQRAPRSVYL